MLIRFPDDKQYWNEHIALPDTKAKRADVLRCFKTFTSIENAQRKMEQQRTVNKLKKSLENITGQSVVLIDENQDADNTPVHDDKELIVDTSDDEAQEIEEMLQELVSLLAGADQGVELDEKGGKKRSVEGKPVQVYFPTGFANKLKDLAKKAGKMTISSYIRDKVM